jgi:ABC-2 type transport system ATP-binding protein
VSEADAAGGTGTDWGCAALSVTRGSAEVLREVSLRVPAGSVTAVVGGDGAGKTTLLRCLAGALAPDRGTIRRPAAARLGYLAAGSGVYPDLTVAENLDFRASAYGMDRRQARARAAGYLERAGLAAAAGRLAGQLSGGMRQKLGVIAAMLHQPDLLVLDEPSTGVDPVSRSDLWWLIGGAAAGGSAVVLATCYLDEAERCGSVLVLHEGTALAAGPPDQITAATPGTLRELPDRPDPAAAARAWRRSGRWRLWEPGPAGPASAGTITPDLQDAVTVAILARRLAGADAGQPAPLGEFGTGRAGPRGRRQGGVA